MLIDSYFLYGCTNVETIKMDIMPLIEKIKKVKKKAKINNFLK